MRRFLLLVPLVGCVGGLSGEDGFSVGRAQLVPCQDPSGDAGALLVIESLLECWVSQIGERPGCAERREFLAQNPQFCAPDIVVDSPSEATMTGYIGQPIDPDNYLAAATTKMYSLPCNPGGRGAEWPDFEDSLSLYTGVARVTVDRGYSGRIQASLTRVPAAGEEPPVGLSLDGEVSLEICRDEGDFPGR